MKTFKLTIFVCLIGLALINAQEIGYINDTDGYSNLRSKPSVKSEIISIIKKGQEFYYQSNNSSNWWQVSFNNTNGFLHKSRIKSLNKVESEINGFYQAYYKTDVNNAEFGEVNNEKLFLAIQDYPLASVRAFCKQKKETQVFLTKQLESPIHDMIDLELIYSRLINTSFPCTEISNISSAVMLAAKKGGLDLTNIKTDFEKNINFAAEFYLNKKEIPKSVLIKLVPENYKEFGIYYGTTGPEHKLGKTGFFYVTTQLIFEQVTSEKNNDFYLPSLKLISFADGEFAEEFIEYLELIIEMDKEKFCQSISRKEYVKHNPIKYYSDLNNCE